MEISRRSWLHLLACAPMLARGSAQSVDLTTAMERIKPLFKPKRPPQPGDWLAEHQEPGQTYQQFRALVRERAVDKYSILRIVPIGQFSKGHAAVFEVTKDFLRPFFGLDIVVDTPISIEEIPANAQRIPYQRSPKQLLTSYLLQKALLTRRKDRDAAVLGITALDLWPGPGWNFVFGQASLTERVGVWSTAYECGMNGSNHSEERDRQPLEYCPECQAKLWWTLRLDPLARSQALEAVARKHGFARVAADFASQSDALA